MANQGKIGLGSSNHLNFWHTVLLYRLCSSTLQMDSNAGCIFLFTKLTKEQPSTAAYYNHILIKYQINKLKLPKT